MEVFENFQIHNLFKQDLTLFKSHDPHLQRIAKLPFHYLSPLAKEPNFQVPGIYLLTGGRQVGKTTFVKQYILRLLEQERIPPENILFLAGELIGSHHALIRILEGFSKPVVLQYLFIDEVNYIPDWDKGIKYLADAGYLDNTVVMLTGSDSLILRTAMQRFAGRRGKVAKVDYLFYPLSFKEFVLLKDPSLQFVCDNDSDYIASHQKFMALLNSYLIHGGYLPAIANYWQDETVYPGTLRTYNEWIIGDMLKLKKSEKHVYEILKGVLSCYSSQISWHSLVKYLSIEHHQTASDYCHLLENIHVLYILEALNENTLGAAPKKNKKIYFQDPFIYHAVSGLIYQDLGFEAIKRQLEDPIKISELIEGIVVSHCKRYNETFYIKGNHGEVDVAIIQGNHFLPIEVKWTSQLRLDDLKQIQVYSNGIILWNRAETQIVNKTPVIPLPKFLMKDII